MKKFIRALIILSLLMSTTICYGDVIDASSKKAIGYISMGRLKPFSIWFNSVCKEE